MEEERLRVLLAKSVERQKMESKKENRIRREMDGMCRNSRTMQQKVSRPITLSLYAKVASH